MTASNLRTQHRRLFTVAGALSIAAVVIAGTAAMAPAAGAAPVPESQQTEAAFLESCRADWADALDAAVSAMEQTEMQPYLQRLDDLSYIVDSQVDFIVPRFEEGITEDWLAAANLLFDIQAGPSGSTISERAFEVEEGLVAYAAHLDAQYEATGEADWLTASTTTKASLAAVQAEHGPLVPASPGAQGRHNDAVDAWLDAEDALTARDAECAAIWAAQPVTPAPTETPADPVPADTPDAETAPVQPAQPEASEAPDLPVVLDAGH
jgi:hypothetical protein